LLSTFQECDYRVTDLWNETQIGDVFRHKENCGV